MLVCWILVFKNGTIAGKLKTLPVASNTAHKSFKVTFKDEQI